MRTLQPRRVTTAILLAAIGALLGPETARAYGGPGSVVSGIGALLAAVGAVVAAIFGFVWFPMKRLVRKLREDDEEGAETTAEGLAAE